MSTLDILTDDTFPTTITNASKPLLVEFGAEWCGPCKQLAPILADFAKKHPEVDVRTVDVDESRGTANQFGIMGVPTLIMFVDGEPAVRVTGGMNMARLEREFGQWLS